MASTHDSDKFWAMFDLDEVPVFRDADDLSRFSVESHLKSHPDRKVLRSRGHLRLTGSGVHEHEADLDQVGHIASTFQRLVTSLGSAIYGARSSISVRAEQLTRLRLESSPAPGSVVLNFVPAGSVEEELRPKGQMLDAGQQLIDQTFDALYPLLAVSGMGQLEKVGGLLTGYGPKTAVALKAFAEVAVEASFDLDILWQEPLKPSKRTSVSAADSKLISQLVSGRNLGEVSLQLIGELKTVSSSSHWVVQTPDFGQVSIDMESIKGAPWMKFNPGAEVVIDATMTELAMPGRASSRSFSANSIRKQQP